MNKFCRDCKHSITDPSSKWNLLCAHPQVLQGNNYVLASPIRGGSSCSAERDKGWLAKCGNRGALWEPK